VIVSLQSIVARNVPPLDTAVVSITTVHGGEAFNIIPPGVEMQGTVRTFKTDVRDIVIDRVQKIIHGTAETYGCRANLEIKYLTPAVVNDPKVTHLVQAVIPKIWSECELDSNSRSMGSEDMAFMLQEVPGCYFFVGSADQSRGLDSPHHHPRFDFDEKVLPYAVALMAASAIELSHQ